MENNGLSTGDLALMRDNGFGDNGFMWIFGLLITSKRSPCSP